MGLDLLELRPFSGLPPLLNEIGNQAGPTGLVTRAKARSRISVEILIEEQMISPMGIFLKFPVIPEARALATFVPAKDSNQAIGELSCDREGGDELTVACFCTHSKIGAQGMAEFHQRPDEQIIRGKPYRPSPIGVATFNPDRGLAGLIAHTFASETKWVLLMVLGNAANSV